MTLVTMEPAPGSLPGLLNKDKAHVVLTALAEQGPMTVNQFVETRGWYVNSWAPTFTRLRKFGYVQRTGDKLPTSHGASAFVIAITDAGRAAMVSARGEALPV